MEGQKILFGKKKIWCALGLLFLAFLLLVIRGIGINSRELGAEEANQYLLQYGPQWTKTPLGIYRLKELGWVITGMLFAVGVSTWLLDFWSATATICLLSVCPNNPWVFLLVVAWTVAVGWVKMLPLAKHVKPVVVITFLLLIDVTALMLGLLDVFRQMDINGVNREKITQTIEKIAATGEEQLWFNKKEYEGVFSYYLQDYDLTWYENALPEETEYLYMLYEEGPWFSEAEIEKYGISYTDMGELWFEGTDRVRLLQVHWGKYGAQERTAAGLERIVDTDADSALVAMTDLSNFKEEYYEIFLGSNMVNLQEVFMTGTQLVASVEMLLFDTYSIRNMYLGVVPERMEYENWEELRELMLYFPDVQFVVFVDIPEKGQLLQEGELTRWEESLRLGVDCLGEMENVHLSYAGSLEWIFLNNSNRTVDKTYTDELALYLVADALMNKLYGIDQGNLEQVIKKQKEMLLEVLEGVYDYENLADKTMFFIGDSVFWDKKGSFSVAGVVADLTGAVTYNLGYGGMTAATKPGIKSGVNGLLSGILAGDYETYGLTADEYFCEQAQKVKEYKALEITEDGKNLIFIFNFGLNDYFEGVTIGKTGELDAETYIGSMEVAIETLQKLYPEAIYVVLGQNYITEMGNGTLERGSDRATLDDYRNALKALAEYMGVHYIDMNQKLGLTKVNVGQHLSDGTHPNHQTCFWYGKAIADYLEKVVSK